MLFTEQDLYLPSNGLSMLNEAIYLTEEEAITNLSTVPVVQNDYFNVNMIDFKDLEQVSEDYGCDILDAMSAIIETENLNPELTTVVIDEADLIDYATDGVQFPSDIIIRPLSEYDEEYQFVAECVEAFLESGEDEYLDILLEITTHDLSDDRIISYARKAGLATKNDDDQSIVAKFHNDHNYASRVLGSVRHQKSLKNPIPAGRVVQQYTKSDGSAGYVGYDSKGYQGQRPTRTTVSSKSYRSAVQKSIDRHKNKQNARNVKALSNQVYDLNDRVDREKAANAQAQNRIAGLQTALDRESRDATTARGHVTTLRGNLQKAGHIINQQGKTISGLRQQGDTLADALNQASQEHEAYKNRGLHRAADKLYAAGNWVKNNKGKTALGVGLGAAAIGGGIYAYQQYKNKPRSVIAKRIAALRGIYKKFMSQVQSNPQKANMLKRAAAKILSVIDKLMGYLQNKADGK